MICSKGRHIFLQVMRVAMLSAVILLLGSCGLTKDAANDEFLGYIDQAEVLYNQMMDEYNALEGNSYGHLERVQLLHAFLADLTEIQEKAGAVAGLDDKSQSAGQEYFNMLYNSGNALSQINSFQEDYLEFIYQVIDRRPLEVDYDELEEYSKDLSAWVQNAWVSYTAIPCPECIKNEWAQYGEILEYNESIAEKVALSVAHNDWLRYYSAKYMTSRYLTVKRALDAKIQDTLWGDGQYLADQQAVTASALVDEIRAYAEMNQTQRAAYEFKNSRAGEIDLKYDAVDTIYPSLYNTYDAFVIVKTGCISGSRTIVIEAEIPGFTQKYRELFHLDSAYTAFYIKPPALAGELDLSSAKNAQINITVSDQDGTLIDSKSFPVTLKSKYDFEWYTADYGISTQDNILCFLTPESSAVTELKRQAIDEIADITDSRIEAFAGYQNVYPAWTDYMITYLQTAGLMKALYDMGVRYNMNPFSISGSSQHIMLPEDVIAQRSGLCVETSLTIASALQSADMHAFLLFPPGHAQVAVEVWNSGEERGEYFLIETTDLKGDINNRTHYVENANALGSNVASTGIISYLSADQWADYLENEVDYMIDCDDSRLLGLTPFAN